MNASSGQWYKSLAETEKNMFGGKTLQEAQESGFFENFNDEPNAKTKKKNRIKKLTKPQNPSAPATMEPQD